MLGLSLCFCTEQNIGKLRRTFGNRAIVWFQINILFYDQGATHGSFFWPVLCCDLRDRTWWWLASYPAACCGPEDERCCCPWKGLMMLYVEQSLFCVWRYKTVLKQSSGCLFVSHMYLMEHREHTIISVVCYSSHAHDSFAEKCNVIKNVKQPKYSKNVIAQEIA